MDAFRWDLAGRSHTPTLDSLARAGTYAEIYPVYPSNTFPSHYAMATGLHPRPPRGREQQFLRPEDRAQGSQCSTRRMSGCRDSGAANRSGTRRKGRASRPTSSCGRAAKSRSTGIRRPSGPLLVETDLLPTRRLGDRRHDAPRSRDPGAGDVVFRRARRHDAHLRPRFTAGSRPGRTYRLRASAIFSVRYGARPSSSESISS